MERKVVGRTEIHKKTLHAPHLQTSEFHCHHDPSQHLRDISQSKFLFPGVWQEESEDIEEWNKAEAVNSDESQRWWLRSNPQFFSFPLFFSFSFPLFVCASIYVYVFCSVLGSRICCPSCWVIVTLSNHLLCGLWISKTI